MAEKCKKLFNSTRNDCKFTSEWSPKILQCQRGMAKSQGKPCNPHLTEWS